MRLRLSINSYKEAMVMSGLTRWEPTTRWNPFKEIEEMEKRLSSLFGRTSVPTGGDKKAAISVAECRRREVAIVPAGLQRFVAAL